MMQLPPAKKNNKVLNGRFKGALYNVAPIHLPLKGPAVLTPKSAAQFEFSWVLSVIYLGQVVIEGGVSFRETVRATCDALQRSMIFT